jgi:glutaryl-CoA dehydrogenase
VFDLLDTDGLLSASELATRERVREFVSAHVLPYADQWFEHARFPTELPSLLGGLGVLGMHLDGYGCPGKSALDYGIACMELEAGDGGIRTFASVQSSLAMSALHKHGSEKQKQAWLPGMARGEAIGCFALTEPGHGSDPGGMETRARRIGGDWEITGRKRWIGNASIADIAVVWARTDEGIGGFLVPQTSRGYASQISTTSGRCARRSSRSSSSTTAGCRRTSLFRGPRA